jgi:glucose/arabinose dehydrogenase
MKYLVAFLFLVLSQSAYAKLDIKVTELASGLERPWAVASLPDGSLMITERNGQLRHWRDGKLSKPIEGLPEVYNAGQGGMLDVKAHPDFATSPWLYFT